jgi:hypothetical protein
MQLLYQSVALSFPQIERMVFEGRSKSTVLNRLARLEKGDLIKRMRVHGFTADVTTASIKVVFQLTKRGIRALSKVPGVRVERDEPVRLHGHSLVHDLLLVEVASALRLKFPSSQTTDGRLWEGVKDPQQPQPDLILTMPDGQKPWAVELELTAKSEKRYRDIILRYRLSRKFDRVLYVTDQPKVIKALTKILEGRFMKIDSREPTKFVHASLEGLLRMDKPEPKGGDKV